MDNSIPTMKRLHQKLILIYSSSLKPNLLSMHPSRQHLSELPYSNINYLLIGLIKDFPTVNLIDCTTFVVIINIVMLKFINHGYRINKAGL